MAGKLKKTLVVLTAEQAAREERAYWLALTPEERLKMLAELRRQWGPKGGQRL